MAKRRRKRRVTRKRSTILSAGGQIAAHPVTYDGFNFDSKLEARWYQSLKMEQDKQGSIQLLSRKCPKVRLDDGTSYTPDLLFISGNGLNFLEIKPATPTSDYQRRLFQAAIKLDKRNPDIPTSFLLGVGNIWHEDPDPKLFWLDGNKWIACDWVVDFTPGQELRFDI